MYHRVRKLLPQQTSANMRGRICLTCHEQKEAAFSLSQGLRAQFINTAFFISQLL